MERKILNQMLINAREEVGMSKNELCYRAGWRNFTQLSSIENSTSNYNINRLFIYLRVLNKYIQLTNGKKTVRIFTEFGFIEWVKKTRGENYKTNLATSAGIARNTLYNLESYKTTIRVDSMLRIIEALGYRIEKIC